MGWTTAAAFALAMQGAASAGAQPGMSASPLAPAFGNTLVSTYPDGRISHLWLSADGTFNGQNRKGEPDGGKWTLTGGRLCMKQYRPFFYPFSWCTAIPGSVAALEGGWKARAPTGEPIVVRLAKGR